MTEPYRIAVTGHRSLGDQATIRFVARSFYSILAQIQHEHAEGVVALFGMAEGADTLFAEAALDLGIPLHAILAHANFIEHFPPGPARHLYQDVLSRCQQIHTLPFNHPSNEAYMAVGRWLADNSDILVAAWNGQPAAGKGGTGDVVYYAQCIGRPVIHVCTTDHTIWHIKSIQDVTSGKFSTVTGRVQTDSDDEISPAKPPHTFCKGERITLTCLVCNACDLSKLLKVR